MSRWPLPLLLALAACQEFTIDKPDDSPPLDTIDTDPAIPVSQPDIEVTPAELRFGSLPPDCAAQDQLVTIKNVGEATLEVTEVALKGLGNEVFTLSDAGPYTLEPDDEVTVTVGFTPSDYVAYDRVKVRVTSNAPGEEQIDVPALGEGSTYTVAEEAFVQEQAGSVDVLWIIDNSESMSTELNDLANAMNTFIQSFVNLGLDFQIGVTTTDMSATGAQGRMLGPIITNATANPVQAFRTQTNQGAAGSADEMGLDASKTALTAPRINQSPNSDLIRADATLSVVVISDEDDYSSVTTQNYSNWLRGMKSDPDDVSFSGMVGPASGGLSACGGITSPTSASAAPRYHQVINATNGVWANFCQFDIHPFLTHLSFVAAGLEFRFQLQNTPLTFAADRASTPEIDGIRVEVDGTLIPYDPVNGWTFDTATNAVEMHGTAIPSPGQTTIISYPQAGTCE
ncbi:MAG: hypothetical protein H6733_05310 [Alphaproteobacteria bacterium]|nr:hypothetical protein [Alphaproteobacteria bacterium]